MWMQQSMKGMNKIEKGKHWPTNTQFVAVVEITSANCSTALLNHFTFRNLLFNLQLFH